MNGMNAITDHINTLPITQSTKWVLITMALSPRNIFTQKLLMKQCGMCRHTLRNHLYQLITCGAVASRWGLGKPGTVMHYYIVDIRLKAHIAAVRRGETLQF